MGLEVYLDQTGTSNQVKIDPNNNTVKVASAPTVLYESIVSTGQKKGPFKKDDVIATLTIPNAGWYKIEWACGLAGRAPSNINDNGASNMYLSTVAAAYRGIYEISDVSMSVTQQPELRLNLDMNKQPLTIRAFADDTNKDSYYVGSITATRIA